MNTPWGKSDTREAIARGVNWVTTPSHGGLIVSNVAARELLSRRAIELSERHPQYVAFEEDCLYAVAFYEHPEWKRLLDLKARNDWTIMNPSDPYMIAAKAEALPKLETELAKTDEQIKADMELIVRRWYPEYFPFVGSLEEELLNEKQGGNRS